MRQLVTLSLLQQQNAADRLQGVNYAYRVERGDTEVLSALLAALNHDENVNVRLAAVEAMRRFGDSPVARRALAQSISKQQSPLVQIALLDQLVALKDREARPAIQQLTSSTSASPEVREHAQWALQQIQ